MKRLLVGLIAAVLVALLGPVGQASATWTPPKLGCHRVYVTPPGWPQPIEITVCP